MWRLVHRHQPINGEQQAQVAIIATIISIAVIITIATIATIIMYKEGRDPLIVQNMHQQTQMSQFFLYFNLSLWQIRY